MMTETVDQTNIRHLKEELDELRQRVADVEAQDKRRMHTALVLLGGAVLALLGYIWASKDLLLGLKR